MLPIRRAALRALQVTAPVARCNSRSFTIALSTASRFPSSLSVSQLQPSSPAQRSAFVRFHRGYATEESEEKSTLESARESASDALDSAKETASQTIDQASDAASSAAAAVTPNSFSFSERPRGVADRFDKPPNKSLYAGNLYFEVSEDTLRAMFEAVAPVKSLKIIYDGRGLSKGFGYVEFEDIETATKVMNQLDQQMLEGRRISVQYASQTRTQYKKFSQSPEGYTNPPSKTLFVGNMSYEMTDKDLNELFREVKNVLDVRVAIDRRTGQPRGFAHADFVDTKSAEAAAEYLKTKEFYGRQLRIDFSTASTTNSKPAERDA